MNFIIHSFLFCALLMSLLVNCNNNAKVHSTTPTTHTTSLDSTLQNHVSSAPQNTLELKVSFQEEDVPLNEYLSEALQPIRANFKKNNSITNWTNIRKIDLEDSSEGGTVAYYSLNSQLQKIIVHHFGEMGKQISEYYLLNEQLSFVFEKSYQYNRPIYYDTTTSQENQDQEVFDLAMPEITEIRSYFENDRLLHLTHSQDCGAPFAKDYLLEEEERIISNYQQLLDIKH